MTPVCLVVGAPATAVKDAVVLPAVMVTEEGTFRKELLLLSFTRTFAVAGAVKVAVQEAEALAERLLGEQLTEARSTGAAEAGVRLKVLVLLTVPALAVRTALCALVTAFTEALKLADKLPWATVTVAGTLTFALLLPTLTPNPPAAAATESPTVQVEDPALPKVVGEQEKPVNAGVVLTIETVPPVPVVATPSPPARDEIGFAT